jgi:hypothetical protein
MKKAMLSAAAVVVCAIFAAHGSDESSGESEVRYRSSFSYGLAMPQSPSIFKNHWKTGGILTYAEDLEFLNEPMLGAMVSIDLGWFEGGDIYYSSIYRYQPLDLLMINVDIMVKWFPIANVKIPYLSGSLGLFSLFSPYTVDYYDDYDSENEDNYALSFSVGAGIDIPIAGMKLYVDARYAGAIGIGGYVAYFPIKFGISLPFSFITKDD